MIQGVKQQKWWGWGEEGKAYQHADKPMFAQCLYSCDVGHAKPDPAFFTEAAKLIGDEPSSVLFVDDNARNVDGARTAGMAAIHWTITDGHDVLLAELAGHGIDVELDNTR